MTAYNKGRRERDFNEGMEERKRTPEQARRAGWVSHDENGLTVWTHPDRPGARHLGSALNIPEDQRR